jgi:MarR family transcriptional regulator, lower aerobic nicotinate degradation pathway regulator
VTPEREPTALLELTVYLLSRSARLGKRDLDARLAERGLRMRDVAVLAAVAESGPTGQLPLGRHVRLDPSDVTATVDALAAAGLVTRSVDPADRRRRLVALTPAGRQALDDARELADRVADDLLAPLDPDRREALHRDLRTVLDARRPPPT